METNQNLTNEIPVLGIERVAGLSSQAHAQVKHEITLFAEPIFYLGGFTVTNSLFTSWIVVFAIVMASLVIKKKIALIPRGLQNYLEVFLEGALNLADSVTGARTRTLRFMPFVLPLFTFILLNNWLGLLPGVGSLGMVAKHGEEYVFVPFLRGGTADLNTTLALAILAVVFTHILGVMTSGAWRHANRFVGVDLLVEMPRKVFKEKKAMTLLVNPIKFFVGLIEVVGELAKVASLALRLFGNVFAGEVLLGAMAALCAFIAPIPFMFLELLVGAIQAMIFAILTLVFLSIMTTSHEERPT